MKIILTLSLSVFLTTITLGQITNPGYDSTLAGKLGADDYGMKMYVLVILKTGSNNVTDVALRNSMFEGHQANIKRLAEQGKLVVAGPIDKNDKSYRGIFILNVTSFDEAHALLDMDPTIKEKIFDLELYNFYGSAALSEYIAASEKIWKKRH